MAKSIMTSQKRHADPEARHDALDKDLKDFISKTDEAQEEAARQKLYCHDLYFWRE